MRIYLRTPSRCWLSRDVFPEDWDFGHRMDNAQRHSVYRYFAPFDGFVGNSRTLQPAD